MKRKPVRTLSFTFRWPGLVEAVALKPGDSRTEIDSEGYRDSGVYDLMVDLDPEDGWPYCFMSANFHKNYPAVIWGLMARMNDEMFDVPQAQLKSVPLHVAFSWAYYHFVLEDGKSLPAGEWVIRIDPRNVTQVVLGHALQMAA